MRKLIWLMGFLCVIWCLWWFAATFAIERGMTRWLESQRKAGVTAQAVISTGGFPLQLRAQLADVTVANPRTGTGLSLTQAALSTPTYWPGYATLTLPDTPIVLTTPAAQFTVQTKDANAQVFLRPGTRLELQNIAAKGGQWAVNMVQGNLVAGEMLALSLVQDEEQAARYNLAIQADNLTPGDILRSGLALPVDWPMSFEAFDADLTVTFAAPLDRTSFDNASPHPRQIDVKLVEITWGKINIAASGVLDIAPDGLPTGEIALSAENWEVMLNLAQDAGVLPVAARGRVELMARALANVDGRPEDLDLTFRFIDGQMMMGPIALGPAPRILYR